MSKKTLAEKTLSEMARVKQRMSSKILQPRHKTEVNVPVYDT
jgi:hypothetical protein